MKAAFQEPLIPIFVAANEKVAVDVAITHYTTWLARSPEKQKKFEDVIQLLEALQLRLSQEPFPQPEAPIP